MVAQNGAQIYNRYPRTQIEKQNKENKTWDKQVFKLDKKDIFVWISLSWYNAFVIFSCDEQLKKWHCHSVCPCFRPSLFFSFNVLEVSSSPKEFQWCFKTV